MRKIEIPLSTPLCAGFEDIMVKGEAECGGGYVDIGFEVTNNHQAENTVN